MEFTADTMLGRLSRWLRLMGYDVHYKVDFKDDDIIANAKGRMILTRDRELFKMAKSRGLPVLLICATDIKGQLSQLRTDVGIKLYDTPKHSRCQRCNGEVQSIEKEKIKDKVPQGVLENPEFWICKNCQKIYWEGSHWKNIRDMVKDIQDGVDDVQNPKK